MLVIRDSLSERSLASRNKREPSYMLFNPVRMDDFDRLYERTHPYVNSTLSINEFKHLANEKAVFNMYTTYDENIPVYAYDCTCKIF